jgi:hypothetical protein
LARSTALRKFGDHKRKFMTGRLFPGLFAILESPHNNPHSSTCSSKCLA